MKHRAEAAGLHATEQKRLGDGAPYYSFLTIFTAVAVHPTDGERDDKSLIRM